MPVLGCGAEMAKLMDVSDQDVQTIEDVIQERIGLGVSQPVAQRQAVAEALAQLKEERSMVMKAIDEQLGKAAANEPEAMFARRNSEPVNLPDAVILGSLGMASKHPDYQAAKSGDAAAASRLAKDLVTKEAADQVKAQFGGSDPVLVPVLSIEASGKNKIPLAVAGRLANLAGFQIEAGILQADSPKRTAMTGVERIFNTPEFDGPVEAGRSYVLVDDTLTQGATFASLASHIRQEGGSVAGAVALTGKQYSAKMALQPETYAKLTSKFGDIESQFEAATGYGFAALTESEARYLANFDPADTIRDRILQGGESARAADDTGDDQGLTSPFSRKANPTTNLYSALAEEVSKINAKAQPADGWKQQIKGLVAKGAVKADEVEWTGLNEWLDLQEGKVTKEAVQAFLDANGVEVQETQLGGIKPAQENMLTEADIRVEPEGDQGRWFIESPTSNVTARAESEAAAISFGVRYFNSHIAERNRIAARDADNTKYGKYTLPGGENYREVLLTLPTNSNPGMDPEILNHIKDHSSIWAALPRDAQEQVVNGYAHQVGVDPEKLLSGLRQYKEDGEIKYQSSHWKDQPNVLAHIRVNDRTDASGAKVLFVEEIQSDWGQDGKKKGFVDDAAKLRSKQNSARSADIDARISEINRQMRDLPDSRMDEFNALADERQKLYDEQNRLGEEANQLDDKLRGQIPAAPFVTKTDAWVNLALKRVVTMAVQEGYDKVAFVNGEQSADRYSLRKQVESVTATKKDNGLYTLLVETKNGQDNSFANLDEQGMEDTVGKEMAQKIVDATSGDKRSARFSGLELEVGGEGMKAFYDKIIPAAVKKLVPKLGGELGTVTVQQTTGFEGNSRKAPAKAIATEQPGFTITDAMREKASQGLPMFSRKQRPAPLAEESKLQAVRRKLQDQYVHVKAIQDMLTAKGANITETQDVYGAEERMHGRAQEKLIDFGRNLLEPLTQKAAKLGVGLDELAAYSYAKHAKERNAHIDTINPNMQGMGSGMSDADADLVMKMVSDTGDTAKFEDLHRDLMKLTEAVRREYLSNGLISQETYDAWTSMYQDYVPLKGFENVDDEGKARPGVGSGLSVKGKESMKALGRSSRAGDIIENVVADFARAVIRGERNRVAQTFLGLVQANPDKSLWEVQPRKIAPSFDRSRDLVVYKQTLDTKDTVGVKVNGQQINIKVHDPLLLRAMTGQGKDSHGEMMKFVVDSLSWYTNLLRNTLTRYNPIFGFINAMRDAPVGALMSYDTLGGKGAALYAKYYAQAWGASGRHELGKPNLSKDMDKYLKEMRLAGGTTSGVYMRDVSEIRDDLRALVLKAGAAPKTTREKLLYGGAIRKGTVAVVQGAGRALEWFGATSEDAARLAAYRAARDMGKTPAQAASIAKNLTTNFNRSGEWGAGINGLYLFFNAGVQGSTRLFQAMANPRVAAVLAAGTSAAMALALLNADLGGDDEEDGVAYWDKIPDYEKQRNLIFMLPPGTEMDGASTVGKEGRYIKIPVQYGVNFFSTLGYTLADMARHAKDPNRGISMGKGATNLLSAMMSSFNPFGGDLGDPTDPLSWARQVLPTVGDTALQLMSGTNAFGKPVGMGSDKKPDSEKYSPRLAGTTYQRLADWMNRQTGGNQIREGGISVMPGTLENVVRNTTGGTGTFLMDVFVNLPTKALTVPELITQRDIPLVRNFYGELDSVSDVGRYYENSKAPLKELETIKAERKAGIKTEYTPEQKALEKMGRLAEVYNGHFSRLRKKEIEVALNQDMPDREREMRRKSIALERAKFAREYNARFEETMSAVR